MAMSGSFTPSFASPNGTKHKFEWSAKRDGYTSIVSYTLKCTGAKAAELQQCYLKIIDKNGVNKVAKNSTRELHDNSSSTAATELILEGSFSIDHSVEDGSAGFTVTIKSSFGEAPDEGYGYNDGESKTFNLTAINIVNPSIEKNGLIDNGDNTITLKINPGENLIDESIHIYIKGDLSPAIKDFDLHKEVLIPAGAKSMSVDIALDEIHGINKYQPKSYNNLFVIVGRFNETVFKHSGEAVSFEAYYYNEAWYADHLKSKTGSLVVKNVSTYKPKTAEVLREGQVCYIPTLKPDQIMYTVPGYIMYNKHVLMHPKNQICFKLKYLEFASPYLENKYINTVTPVLDLMKSTYTPISKKYTVDTQEYIHSSIIKPFILFINGKFIPYEIMDMAICPDGAYLIIDTTKNSNFSNLSIEMKYAQMMAIPDYLVYKQEADVTASDNILFAFNDMGVFDRMSMEYALVVPETSNAHMYFNHFQVNKRLVAENMNRFIVDGYDSEMALTNLKCHNDNVTLFIDGILSTGVKENIKRAFEYDYDPEEDSARRYLYQCPYCELQFTKENLIKHVRSVHPEHADTIELDVAGMQPVILDPELEIVQSDEELSQNPSLRFDSSLLTVNEGEEIAGSSMDIIFCVNTLYNQTADIISKANLQFLYNYASRVDELSEEELAKYNALKEEFNLTMNKDLSYANNVSNAINAMMSYDHNLFNETLKQNSNIEISEYNYEWVQYLMAEQGDNGTITIQRMHSEMTEEFILMLVNGELYKYNHLVTYRANQCIIPIYGLEYDDKIEILRFKNINNTSSDIIINEYPGFETEVSLGSYGLSCDTTNMAEGASFELVINPGAKVGIKYDPTQTEFVVNIDNPSKAATYLDCGIYRFTWTGDVWTIVDNGYRYYSTDIVNKNMVLFSDKINPNSDPDFTYPEDGLQHFPINYSMETDPDSGLIKIMLEDPYYYGKKLKLAYRNRYAHHQFVINKDNTDDEVQYSIDLGDKYKYCTDYTNFILFMNGRKLDANLYRVVLPVRTSTPFYEFKLYISVPVLAGDRFDLVYLPTLMQDFVYEDNLGIDGDIVIDKSALDYGLHSDLYIVWINGKKVPKSDIANLSSGKIKIITDQQTTKNLCVTKIIPPIDVLVEAFKYNTSKLDDLMSKLTDAEAESMLDIPAVQFTNTEDDIREGSIGIDIIMRELIREQYLMNPRVALDGTFVYGYRDVDDTEWEISEDGNDVLLFPVADATLTDNLSGVKRIYP